MRESPLLCEPADKAALEAANGVAQIDYIASLVNEYRVRELRESHVLELQRLAIDGIYPCGGQYRNALRRIEIEGSAHRVPHEAAVQALVRDTIDRINRDKGTASAMERASYALWRFNWIHPFAGGNGRTSRALAYLILCMDLGAMLPGDVTVPTLIHDLHRQEYVHALRAADATELANGQPDLTRMTNLLQDVVTRQLASAIERLAARKH